MRKQSTFKGFSVILILVSAMMIIGIRGAFAQSGEAAKRVPGYKTIPSSSFLTINAEYLGGYRPNQFFNPQVPAFGFKAGTMRNVGWFVSGMTNFNFKGTFVTCDAADVREDITSSSYFEALAGITLRYWRPLSFHLGLGYFYRSFNNQTIYGQWAHVPNNIAQGPISTVGFMFHLGGFVVSAELVGGYNMQGIKSTDYRIDKTRLTFGAKAGLGICIPYRYRTEFEPRPIRSAYVPTYYNQPEAQAPVTHPAQQPEAPVTTKVQQTVTPVATNTVATVTTLPVTQMSTDWIAVCGHVDEGFTEIVTERGICWSTTPYPTINGAHTSDGTGIGYFTTIISNLQPNMTYYLRAYARVSSNILYGNIVSVTLPDAPAVPATHSAPAAPTYPQQPVYQQPIYQQPVYQQPVYQQPVYQQPVYLQPVYPQPIYPQQPMYQQPVYPQQPYQQPYQQPVYQQQPYQQPVYQQPAYPQQPYTQPQYQQPAYPQQPTYPQSVPQQPFFQQPAPQPNNQPVSTEQPALQQPAPQQPAPQQPAPQQPMPQQPMPQQPMPQQPMPQQPMPQQPVPQQPVPQQAAPQQPVPLQTAPQQPTPQQPEPQQTAVVPVPVPVPQQPDAQPSQPVTEKAAPAVPECPASVQDVDGNQYSTVLIGNQCWMKENMRAAHFTDGSLVTLSDTASYDLPYRYLPNNDSTTVANYGFLYNWAAATNRSTALYALNNMVQGICPDGWHLPSDAEWNTLTSFLATQPACVCGYGTQNIAKSMASTSGWTPVLLNGDACSVGQNQGNNNTSGFGAFPAGVFRNKAANFGNCAGFWSSTPSSNGINACFLFGESAQISTYSDEPGTSGFSVRCLKNMN